jgi:transcriptional regulator with XRE-family HTH domain
MAGSFFNHSGCVGIRNQDGAFFHQLGHTRFMTTMPPRTDRSLGDRLRALREKQGWSLREVATRAGVNHGYLSQLERNEVAEPAPSMLHKLAEGYGEPFAVLMQWAGYIEEGLSPNQSRALSYLGRDPSDEELKAIKAILEVLRAKRATFSAHVSSLDGDLTPEDLRNIRARSNALLRRADACGLIPTPLEQLLEVAQLVASGEITLDEEEKRRLRKRFGSLVDLVLGKLLGVVHFKAREVWVQPDLYLPKKRFVTAHEIGHDLLPWQRDSIAYLDDDQRLRQDVRLTYERQANQVAIELLAQGDLLRSEADDSALTIDAIIKLANRYQISLVATARRVVEETRKEAALTIRFCSNGRTGPSHLYSSVRFSHRFGWSASGLPHAARLARDTVQAQQRSDFTCVDLSGGTVPLQVEICETGFGMLALFTPRASSRNLLRRVVGRPTPADSAS